MRTKHFLRFTLAAVMGSTIACVQLPAASAQQADRCLPSGVMHAPIPWPQRTLAADQVWQATDGSGQRVAVISTGVAKTPFLRGRVGSRVDVAPAPEFGETSGRADCVGKGTGVAGIVAGVPIPHVGFQGVAPGARILSAKVVGDQYPTDHAHRGSVTADVLADGIRWAIEQDATVIAVAEVTYDSSDRLRSTVRRALDRNIVVVAPVGQVARDEPSDATPYPAAFDGVIGVAAVDERSRVSDASRPAHVDLVAPGENVITTYPGGGLGPASGGGYAVGYVAGTAALVREYWPGLARKEVVGRLLATAAPAHEGVGSPRYGHGLVNPYGAVFDQTVRPDPVGLPSLVPSVISEAELARQEGWERSTSLAYGLAAAGIALAALVTAIVVFGPKGRRRRWRSGIAATPKDRPEDTLPEPPVELFAERQTRAD